MNVELMLVTLTSGADSLILRSANICSIFSSIFSQICRNGHFETNMPLKDDRCTEAILIVVIVK